MTGSAGFVVFAGPTLHGVDGSRILDARFLPPASQGDVYAAAKEKPWAIGLIDGFFERVPAVWHKEILWAMTRGVRVYGSGSMGALRAAELHPFGMRGVGRVFRWIADGALEDDDEVAIVHAPAELDYMPMSEAMVNIRATIEAATAGGVVTAESAAGLTRVAKALFYPDRSYARVCAAAVRAGVSVEEVDAFQSWLPHGRVDQKQRDAIAMLEQMAHDHAAAPHVRQTVAYRFQHTDAWEQVRRQIDRKALSLGTGTETYQHDAVLDELRLDPDEYVATRTEALIRSMALEIDGEAGDDVGDTAIEVEVDRLRRLHGLDTPEQVQRWLHAQGITTAGLTDLIVDEARVRRVRAILSGRLDGVIADILRLSGRQGALERRAQEKHEALALRGLENPTGSAAGVTDDELWRWYFETRLGREVPDDLEAAAAGLDYLDVHAMRRTVLREYCFEQIAAEPDQRGVP